MFKSRAGRTLRVLMWAFAFTLWSQAPASAGSVTFEGICKYPLVDKLPGTFTIEASIPSDWNRSDPPSSINWRLNYVDHGNADQLIYRTGASLTVFGTAKIAVSVARPDGSVALIKVPLTLDRWDRAPGVTQPFPPNVPDQFSLSGSSSVPPGVEFSSNGVAKFAVTGVVPTLSTKDNGQIGILRPLTTDIDGNLYTQSDTDPSTSDILCRPNAGEDTTVATTDVYSAPTSFTSTNPFVGSATMPTISPSTIALRGTINTTRQVSDGSIKGSVDFAEVWTRLKPRSFGSPPTSGKLAFIPVSTTTGVIDSRLTLTQLVRIKLTESKLFGVTPLGLGNDCQAKKLTTITYTSTEPGFAFDKGGTLEARFPLSDFNGCAEIAELFSPATLNADNTLRLTVKPELPPQE